MSRKRYAEALEEALLLIGHAHSLLPVAEPHPTWWRRWLGQKREWTAKERIERAETFLAGLKDGPDVP